MQYRFKKLLKNAGIDDINFHALRLTFATRCIEMGIDVKTISELLGHSNVNITLNRYVHPEMIIRGIVWRN
jgi:integrase